MPRWLREAGRDTPTVAKFGRELLDLDKPGPAELVLAAARKIGVIPAPPPSAPLIKITPKTIGM